MKFWWLISSGLSRSPLRTLFTMASFFVTFVAFGALQGVSAGFDQVIENQRLDRLVTDPRRPDGPRLPVSVLAEIEKTPGVTAVAARGSFIGYYKDPKNFIFANATDPERWLAVRPEFSVSPQQMAVLKRTRTGMVVTRSMMDRFGWRIGERIPIQSPIGQADGSGVWMFDLVGLVSEPEGLSLPIALIHYDYLNETRGGDRDTVDRFLVRIADPHRSTQTASLIDQIFTNSSHETRTQSERAETQTQLKQIGDVRFFTNAIAGAGLFMLLFLTGNTMMQSVNERAAEFGVLKALGSSNMRVALLVVAEALVLCVLPAVLALVATHAALPWLKETLEVVQLSGVVVLLCIGAAVLVALISACIPVFRVNRQSIAAALSGG